MTILLGPLVEFRFKVAPLSRVRSLLDFRDGRLGHRPSFSGQGKAESIILMRGLGVSLLRV